jgi:hippurate hydrolase
MVQGKKPTEIVVNLDEMLPELEALYKDIHTHTELSMLETRTAGLAADHLRASGFEVTTEVGKTGVVGILRNGDGPTVMLRADMDALPIKEATGLPYASSVIATDSDGMNVPVAHSCGHDMHVTCLIGAASLFAKSRDSWKGTVMAVFQPGEETAQGAQAMIDDNLFERFPKPDVVLGQHVMSLPSGHLDWRTGCCDLFCRQPANPNIRTWRARLNARSEHRSRCHGGLDRDQATNHHLAGSRSDGFGCGDDWGAASRHKRERHS